MQDYSEEELDKIVKGFIDKSLDKTLWTHHAHLITALWFLMNFEKEDALCRLRSGIIAYNLSLGGENTGQHGYHETITVFWWEVISRFVAAQEGSSFPDMCTKFLRSPMTDKNFPFRFYSKEKLLSPVARARFVEPDLSQIVLPVEK